MQPQLLRALQEREVLEAGWRGSPQVDVQGDIRHDAATDGEGCDFKAALRHRLERLRSACCRCANTRRILAIIAAFLTVSCRELGRTELLPGANAGGREIAAGRACFLPPVPLAGDNVRELANTASSRGRIDRWHRGA